MERRVHVQQMADGQWIGVSEVSGAVMLGAPTRNEALKVITRNSEGDDLVVIVHGPHGEVLDRWCHPPEH